MLLCFALMFFFHINAQNRSINGNVKQSGDGKSVSGVSVIVKGTNIGTITDAEGAFQLDIPQTAQALVFSFVGLKTVVVPASSDNFDIILFPDYIGISEIVTTGYSNRGRNEITGSTVQVNGKVVANVPVTSVDQALQGKVPGLVVTAPSGTPGTMQDIRIRGVGSITASNQPLFVIDGVPVINADFTGEV